MSAHAALAGAIQVASLSTAVIWRTVAPGPNFAPRTAALLGTVAAAWVALLVTRRHFMTWSSALRMLGLGLLLPMIWIVAIVLCEVSVPFAITAPIFGLVFLAFCPLYLWGAFVGGLRGSQSIAARLLGR